MTTPDTNAAIDYHSKIAVEFHGSYQRAANCLERGRVWKMLIDRYGRNAALAYDLGCGSGVLTCELAKRGIQTIGIDGSESMLQLAARTAAEQQISNISFVRHQQPLANPQMFSPADLVLSSCVIEYLPSVENALQDIETSCSG